MELFSLPFWDQLVLPDRAPLLAPNQTLLSSKFQSDLGQSDQDLHAIPTNFLLQVVHFEGGTE